MAHSVFKTTRSPRSSTKKAGGFRMSWAQAVKQWNSVQFFKDDLYGIPRKGGIYYDDVKEIMDASKFKKDVAKMMGKEPELPKITPTPVVESQVKDVFRTETFPIDIPQGALEKLASVFKTKQVQQDVKEFPGYTEYRTKRGKTTNVSIVPKHTKEEETEAELLKQEMAELKSLKDKIPEDIWKAKARTFNEKSKRLTERIDTRVKKERKEQKAVETKPETKSETTPVTKGTVDNWRETLAGYADERSVPPLQRKHGLVNLTKIPSQYSPSLGFDWLEFKYGASYTDMIEKVKKWYSEKKGTMSKQEMKNYFRVGGGVPIQEFLDDVAYADPTVYDAISFNITRKPGSLRRVEKEFTSYLEKKGLKK